MENIIDTHVHTWDLEQLRLPWLDTEKYLNRTFLEEDYQKNIASDCFTVVDALYVEVDCAPSDRMKENNQIIDKCKDPGSIFSSAVISGDLTMDRFEDYIKNYHSDISGIRQVLHTPERRKGFCLQPKFIQNVRYLGEVGLSFDLCMRSKELSDGYELAKHCPKTKIILNHMGNPDMKILGYPLTDEKRIYRDKWLSDLKKLSDLPNVYCKISGILETEKSSFEDFSREINYVMDIFGEDRILYASNFPVINLGGNLSKWTNFLLKLTDTRTKEFKRKLFSENAQLVYLNFK